jgi:hypothetical protein
MALFLNYTQPSIPDERGIAPGTWNTWFPFYKDLLNDAVASCVIDLPKNTTKWGIPLGGDSIKGRPDYFDLISCVSESLPEQAKLAMVSAQVLLGLTPALISTLSPSVGEITLLSSYRPILSTLISLGCPSTFSARSLEYNDPLAILKLPDKLIFRPKSMGQKRWISALEYFLVSAAIANIIIVDTQLAFNTINVWVAGRPYLIYIWSIFSIIPHALAALAFYLYRSPTGLTKLVKDLYKLADDLKQFAKDLFLLAKDKCKASLKSEVTICAAQEPRGYELEAKDRPFHITAMNILASLFSYVLLIYGTFLFSSLLFIGPLDALTVIIRYFGSTIVCRMVLAFELSGIVAAESKIKRVVNLGEVVAVETKIKSVVDLSEIVVIGSEGSADQDQHTKHCFTLRNVAKNKSSPQRDQTYP